jgi:DNA-binding Lrp family transcriptional regulator
MIKRLEKEGYIKEYTMIPDFRKLGYQIMGITLLKHNVQPNKEEFAKIRKEMNEIDRQNPHALLLAVNGIGLGKDKLFITFYEDYSAYWKAMELTRGIPYFDMQNVESFLVDINDETNYKLLSMAAIAHHLSLRRKG